MHEKRNSQKKKDKLIPWATKGIKKLMPVREKIYKQMINEKYQLIETEKYKTYKTYRNKTTDFLKTSKQTHCHK